jgi:hypothetical protein
MNRRLYCGVFLWLIASAAFADAIPYPLPEKCPSGAVSFVNHDAEGCAPLSCKTDADCQGGLVCKYQPLCIERKSVFNDRYGKTNEYQLVSDVCANIKDCISPSTCEPGMRCVAKAPEPKPTPSATSQPATKSATPTTPNVAPKSLASCAVSSPEDDAGWLVLLLFFWWIPRRRSVSI